MERLFLLCPIFGVSTIGGFAVSFILYTTIFILMLLNFFLSCCLAPDDYTTVTGQILTFSESISEVCVPVDIIDDDAIEGDEVFVCVVSTSSSRIQFSNPPTTVTIIDNDRKLL